MGFVSACSWLALVTGVGGYVLAGVEIGGLSCIFLYFAGVSVETPLPVCYFSISPKVRNQSYGSFRTFGPMLK